MPDQGLAPGWEQRSGGAGRGIRATGLDNARCERGSRAELEVTQRLGVEDGVAIQ